MISYIPQSVLYVLLLGLVHLVMFCVVVIIRENNYVKKLLSISMQVHVVQWVFCNIYFIYVYTKPIIAIIITNYVHACSCNANISSITVYE